MVPELQPLGKHSDRGRLSVTETLHLQQQQIVLRLDAGTPGGHFTEPEKPADVIPELGQCPVVDVRRASPVPCLSRHSHIISENDILLCQQRWGGGGARGRIWPEGVAG